jgi:hydroxymethylpyrimidine pyrophosphatase-like HAD family hydrolase
MRLIIDLDGTLCEEKPTFERSLAKPIPLAIQALRRLKIWGHHITIYTARGWMEYDMTKSWLDNYDIPYDNLICGKPVGDLWIDDRAIKFTDWREVYNAIANT